MELYTFCLKNDCGASPNPFGNYCTLALTKPAIRRSAKVGDWIVGFASPESGLKDASRRVVFAMKVTNVLSMSDYNDFCRKECAEKIPQRPSATYEQLVGDCIYDFIEGVDEPVLRPSVHDESNIDSDLKGKNVLISQHYVYWGNEAPELPQNLWKIIKKGKGHQVEKNRPFIKDFEKFIKDYEINSIFAPPIHKINNWYCAESRGQCAQVDLEDNLIDEKIEQS